MKTKRFANSDPSATVKNLSDVLRWQRERKGKVKDFSYRIGQADNKEAERLRNNRNQTTVTWIGHSTFLLQTAGLTILTDPVWASRMGFARRYEAPGLTLEELPPIDVLLLSHSHYDHLHTRTLRKLRMSDSPAVLVPAGLGGMLQRMKLGPVTELDWWDSHTIGDLTFHFVPAQHWTRRSFTDTNKTLWGGWVVSPTIAPAKDGMNRADSIYFAGDSGYFQGFREIGAKFPGIRYALMPIGAYEPEWFMGSQHVTPEEAVQAFLDIGAECFIPMHYGAFQLADDTPKEALDRLLADWQARELDASRLHLLKHGETHWKN